MKINITRNTEKRKFRQQLYNAILGFAVGDAMGVPYEGTKRGSYKALPSMAGYGAYNQPPGTWSDDTALTLSTIASIGECGEANPDNLMRHFVDWLYHAKYTAGGENFDVGNTTKQAIEHFTKNKTFCPNGIDNGSGALMRILPIAFLPDAEQQIEPVARLTHIDSTSTYACKIYISVAKHLLSGKTACEAVAAAIGEQGSVPYEFRRLYVLSELPVNEIYSTGYAVHTLEAALWCVIHGDSYKKTVMLAISLGEETGTIAALAGGLAGVCYGFACGRKRIPRSWIKKLRNRHIIEPLCDKMAEALA